MSNGRSALWSTPDTVWRPGSRPGRSIQTAMPYSPFTTFKASMDLSDGTCRYIRQPGSRPGRFIQHHYDAGICINSFYFYFSLSAMQTWNSLLNRSTVFTDGVKSRLFHFQTGTVVWIHVHDLSVSGFGLPFGVFMPSKENSVGCVRNSYTADYSCRAEQRRLTGLMALVS